MKHRINKGIKMCAGIFAALLLAGCSTREQDKQPNAKQDVTAETEGEALVYSDMIAEVSSDARIGLSKTSERMSAASFDNMIF